jgi:hypothetical protein
MTHAPPLRVAVDVRDEKAVKEDEKRQGGAEGDPRGKGMLVGEENEQKGGDESEKRGNRDSQARGNADLLTEPVHARLPSLRTWKPSNTSTAAPEIQAETK